MRKYLLSVVILCIFFCAPPVARGADFPYTHYESLLKRYVKPGATIDGVSVAAVDYVALASDAKNPDSAYSLLLKELAAFDPATLGSREEKMAFWINVYNIAAMKTIVDHYPVDSIRSRKINWLGLPWDRKAITVGGREYTLGEIEFDKLVEGSRTSAFISASIALRSVASIFLLSPSVPTNSTSSLRNRGNISSPMKKKAFA